MDSTKSNTQEEETKEDVIGKDDKKDKKKKSNKHGHIPNFKMTSFPIGSEFFFEDEYPKKPDKKRHYFVIMNFQSSLLIPENQIVIGSKFDTEGKNKNLCRIGFYGKFLHEFKDEQALKSLKLYRLKDRTGNVDRVTSDTTLIVKNLF